MLGKALSTAAAGNAAGEATYVEDVFSTYLYTGNGYTQSIQNGIALGSEDPVISLIGYTFTSIGSAIHSSYPLSNINDGVAETTNGSNLTYVSDGNFDVYVDLQTPQTVIAYLIAPQGGAGQVYNTPLNFKVHGSSDGSNWTEIEYFQNISTGSSNWTAGTYREFSFTNTTAYRYWRFDHIGNGSDSSGVAISELKFKADGGDAEAKGGLVWLKSRGSTHSHTLYDTERGAEEYIMSNATNAEATLSTGLTSFNNNGFTHGSHMGTNDVASWTFAKQEKFFDVVTWTGTGGTRTISHNLNATVGMLVMKATSTTSDWVVYHRGLPNAATNGIYLDRTDAAYNSGVYRANTAPTDSVFTVDNNMNASGTEYVAYLFAHNNGDGIFGENGDQDIIKCGSYSGGNQTIDLGFEPQFIIVKRTDAVENWMMFDSMRGWNADGDILGWLMPNASNAESTLTNGQFELRSDGFFTGSGYTPLNGGSNYIYIAIRRGPMKTPESGTEVFAIDTLGSTGDGNEPGLRSGFPIDALIWRPDKNTTETPTMYTRMTSSNLYTSETNAENVNSTYNTWFQYMNGWLASTATDANDIAWMFRRAPGFFDVVAYTGTTASSRTIDHNLGVVPEMMIIKCRDLTYNWIVYHKEITATGAVFLNLTNAEITASTYWNNTEPTDSVFTLGTSNIVHGNNLNYIAYLFATVPGVSKVGSFSHTNGSTTDVDCGFTTGARFVMLKRYNTTGNWIVMDTERGIVAGNDPYLSLNTTGAEVTTADVIDPLSSGFQVASGFLATGDWIFLAIA